MLDLIAGRTTCDHVGTKRADVVLEVWATDDEGDEIAVSATHTVVCARCGADL